MPTVLRVGPYRFFFYSSDAAEPRHIHVEHEDNRAKFWLEPVRLQTVAGFDAASSPGSPPWWQNIRIIS